VAEVLMSSQLNYAVVIPARYQSSRFPGKPLVDILGKPMIQHVWERCVDAVGAELVYVATDSKEIQLAVEAFGGQVVMTSSECLTGTDRLAEANVTLKRDFLINVQGDEPLINPDDIVRVIKRYQDCPEQIVNAMAAIHSEEEFRSNSVPKVVASKSGRLMYMSRAAIPTTKELAFEGSFKQVCIYAFSAVHLAFFASSGEKTPIENLEDIEILRFLENDIPVQMVEVDSASIAVDFPEDVERVVRKIK
jgi:3-deoxy-manno-octulosonate cytidylyltransferase (CMP-KDO synthetase)